MLLTPPLRASGARAERELSVELSWRRASVDRTRRRFDIGSSMKRMLFQDSDEEKQGADTETTGREAVSFPVDGLSTVNKRRS